MKQTLWLNWKTDLFGFLDFLSLLFCTGAATVHTVAGREQLRSPLQTLFGGHPAEAGNGPGLATGPEGRATVRVSTLLEMVRRHLLLKILFQSKIDKNEY